MNHFLNRGHFRFEKIAFSQPNLSVSRHKPLKVEAGAF